MKTILLATLFFGLFNLNAQAELEKYHMKKITCTGESKNHPSYYVTNGYQYIGVEFIQFKSQRTDGSYADSLGTGSCFGRTLEDVETRVAEGNCAGSLWYSSILREKLGENSETIITDKYEEMVRLELGNQLTPRTYSTQGRFNYWGNLESAQYYQVECVIQKF